jgi:hypothetical protein
VSREPTYLTVTTPQHLYPNSAVFRLELRSRSSNFPVLTFPIQLTEVTEFQLRVHYDIASAPRSSCCYPHYITSPVLAVIPVIFITLPLYLLSIALKLKNPFFMVLTMKRIENKKAPLGISLFYHVDQPRGYTLYSECIHIYSDPFQGVVNFKCLQRLPINKLISIIPLRNGAKVYYPGT